MTDTEQHNNIYSCLEAAGKINGGFENKPAQQPDTYKCSCGQVFEGNFCPSCGAKRIEEASFSCACGYRGPLSKFCPDCGTEVLHEQLFSLSEYSTGMPPRSYYTRVYRFDGEKLVMDKNGKYFYVSSDVIEPAMEIIRKSEIDKWEQYKDNLTGIMGGSQTVYYFNGQDMVGTSTDHMPGAGSAYNELMMLFTVSPDSENS